MKKRNKITCVVLMLLFCSMFVGCSDAGTKKSENDGNEQEQQVQQDQQGEQQKQEEEEQIKEVYEVDYYKVSPMIEDNVQKEVIDAALNVIRAFMNYENEAQIAVSGNEARFLNDMGYVINSTCPMFTAMTNYSEMTSYDKSNGTVKWDFYVSQEDFTKKVTEFTQIVEECLSTIQEGDSDSMKAVLLYYEMLRKASYDYEILGDAYETMDEMEYRMRDSAYGVFVNKKGICTNLSQALMFLYTQVGLTSGTVLHQGGSGAHMWVVVKVDGKYYYCDPTWDVGSSLKTFGITAEDRSSWAGEYAKNEGTMFSTVIDQKYDISDGRFATLRQKVPVEITEVKVDRENQTITFVGYEYEYTFTCAE